MLAQFTPPISGSFQSEPERQSGCLYLCHSPVGIVATSLVCAPAGELLSSDWQDNPAYATADILVSLTLPISCSVGY